MNISFKALLAAAGLLGALAAQAQTLPSDAPAGSTVQCKDGSYAAPDTKAGACRGHKGIKTWFGDVKPAAAAVTASPAPAAVPAVQTQSSAVSKTNVAPPTGEATRTPGRTDPATMAAAAGGGAGKVWANDETKVYHCMGDRYYGKTKKGEYLSEADAKAKGMHAARNKPCAA
ncbi:MAG: hypothetical protein JWQ03_2756 [Variovorax sp.]|nr:hypothetical protein [Variovorax sp.]